MLRRRLARSQVIMLGFLGIIFAGALLLMLPFATRAGEETTFLGALFTAVSSTCVTGLVAYDTWNHWTLFGQIVVLGLIQIGGLGFITISTFLMILLHKRVGLSRRALIQDSLSTLQIKGSVLLVRRIIVGTVCFEALGAVLLGIRFVPEYGLARGLWYGIFHGVSAFCNAGFDLMGHGGAFSSFCGYYDDPLVILTLCGLIIIGGIGFLVWEDIWIHRHHWKRYRFHTKIVLVTTAGLLVGSTLLFLLFERNAMFRDMNGMQKFLAAFFSAVTPRTAGFNSVDTASLSGGSFLLTIVLMFIGGSPGSTAGGMKTTTLFVILLYLKSYLLRDKDAVAFSRRIDDESVRKASTVVLINLLLAVVGCSLIFAFQTLPLRDVLFEVASAIGTAGMSTGVTRDLCSASRIVIMILMYLGRMGSLTFAMSFTEHRSASQIRYPEEQIVIG